jgi:hypothetical protein
MLQRTLAASVQLKELLAVVKTAKTMYRNAAFFDAILILKGNLTFNYTSFLQFLDLAVIFTSGL